MKLKIVHENGEIDYINAMQVSVLKDGKVKYLMSAYGTGSMMKTVKNYTRIELDGEIIASR